MHISPVTILISLLVMFADTTHPFSIPNHPNAPLRYSPRTRPTSSTARSSTRARHTSSTGFGSSNLSPPSSSKLPTFLEISQMSPKKTLNALTSTLANGGDKPTIAACLAHLEANFIPVSAPG